MYDKVISATNKEYWMWIAHIKWNYIVIYGIKNILDMVQLYEIYMNIICVDLISHKEVSLKNHE